MIHCDFFSEVLGISTSMYVILPQATNTQIGMQGKTQKEKHPVLYLLHGLSDDHTIWLRRTSIERYVAPLGIAVVMPAVNRSFYTDMVCGYRYWTFISEELPILARSFFPLSDAREDNFVAGLSMGGYGAFKLGLRCPHKFCAAASLSGCFDFGSLDTEIHGELQNIFGDSKIIAGSENDLFYLAGKLAGSEGLKPKLYQCCGTEDSLNGENHKFFNFCRELPLDLTYEEEPGEHEWGYWDKKIRRVLEWLPINQEG